MFASFMANAWIVGSMVAIVAGCVGFFVVIRGAAFAAHALPLGAFPGATAAGLLGLNPLLGMVVFSGLGVLGISWFGRRQRRDIATTLTLVTLLGLGALFLSFSQAYAQNLYALLFGEVLGIGRGAILPVLSLSLLCLVAVAALFRPLLLSALSPELAAVRGRSPAWLELGFLGILALATAMALPVVGVLLVFSLMVGPASAARTLASRPLPAMVLSAGLALLTVWAAIALSYLTDWPVGLFVGGIGVLWYGLGRAWAARPGRLQAAAQAAQMPPSSTTASRG